MFCNILFPFTKAYLPDFIFKLINITFLPYLYVYLIGMYVYTFKERIVPILKNCFWGILLALLIWGSIRKVIGFSLGHYRDIITGTLTCFLTLAAGYKLGRHKLKKDFSYSLYLYHMIVVNALLVLGIKESLFSIVLVYLITIFFSFLSVTWIGPIGRNFLKKTLADI